MIQGTFNRNYLYAYPTAQADLARVASFSTETRLGRAGKAGTSLSMPRPTLLFSLLQSTMGLARVESGKLVPGVAGSTWWPSRCSCRRRICCDASTSVCSCSSSCRSSEVKF